MIYNILIILVLSIFINLLLIFCANKIGLVDDPNKKKLAIHKKPIAISGGLSIVLSTLVAISILRLTGYLEPKMYYDIILLLFLPSIAVVIFGMLDDFKNIPPLIRLFYQSAASIIVLTTLFPKFTFLSVLEAVLLIFLILGTISATNMTDGMDGLCGTMAAVTISSYFFISKGQIINIYLLSLVLTVFTFLIFNFNPAKVFLGNCGSEFLGFSIGISATILILSSAKPLQIALIISMIGVPIIEMFSSISRRLINHQPIISGDRNHIYDRMLKRGFSQRKVWLILTVIQIAINGFSIYFYFAFK